MMVYLCAAYWKGLIAQMDECMVSVFCTTYNQKKYITRCLDSLTGQKTDFAYEIIVRDDASTDGTSDIVREYAGRFPDKIVPFILPENMYQRGLGNVSYEQMFRMSRGKYVAICEGDDFWTDDCKLQKQVDFMESHPEYALCGHAAYFAAEDGTIMKDKLFRPSQISRDLSTEDIIGNWTMATCSLLFRKSCRPDIIIPFQGKCINADYAQMVYLSLKGKVYYMNELMSAYRMSSNGSVSQKANRDRDFFKSKTLSFVEMLDRLDAYTDGRFSDVITRRKRVTLFHMYLGLGDTKNLKQYRDVAHSVGFRTRIRYLLCVYLHPVYRFIDNTYQNAKT